MTDSYYMRRTSLVDACRAARAVFNMQNVRSEKIWKAELTATKVEHPNGAYLYIQQRLLAAAITHEHSHQTPI